MQSEAVAGLVISGLALIVAVWAAVQTGRAARMQNEIQRRLLDLEIAREEERRTAAEQARLRAGVVRSGNRIALRIVNDASSVARNVRVLIDGLPMAEHALALDGQNEAQAIGPGAEVEYLLAPTMASPDVIEVRLEWTELSGATKQWESQLRLS